MGAFFDEVFRFFLFALVSIGCTADESLFEPFLPLVARVGFPSSSSSDSDDELEDDDEDEDEDVDSTFDCLLEVFFAFTSFARFLTITVLVLVSMSDSDEESASDSFLALPLLVSASAGFLASLSASEDDELSSVLESVLVGFFTFAFT